MPNSNNNVLTEIGVILISVALIGAATVLLLTGKIDFTAATFMLLLVASIFGVNGALKASSPAQQAQLQQFTSQVLDTLPSVVAAVHPPIQVASPAPQQPQPLWPVGASQPPDVSPAQAPAQSVAMPIIPPQLSLPSTFPQTLGEMPAVHPPVSDATAQPQAQAQQ